MQSLSLKLIDLQDLEYAISHFLEDAYFFASDNLIYILIVAGITAYILLNRYIEDFDHQYILDRTTSYGKGLKGKILNNLFYISIILAILGFFIIFSADVPELLKLAYFWFIIISFLLYVPVRRHILAMYQPERYPLVEFRAEEDHFRMYELTPKQFKNLKLKNPQEYDLSRYKAGNGQVYLCRYFNPDGLMVEGTWMGGLDDLELLDKKDNIKKLRRKYEDEVRQARYFMNHKHEIVREAVARITSSVISGIEEDTIYRGEYIQDVVDDIMAEYTKESRLGEYKEYRNEDSSKGVEGSSEEGRGTDEVREQSRQAKDAKDALADQGGGKDREQLR